MKDLFIVAREVQTFLDARKWRSCVIGGIAVQRWGEPRLTRDVDVTLLTGIGGEVPFVDETDVKGIIDRRGPLLKWTSIFEELRPLCELKESPETVDRLERMRDRTGGNPRQAT
jgi:hypothetical protein